MKYQKREPLTEIPKGYIGSNQSCPIANALNAEFRVSIGRRRATFTDAKGKEHDVKMPATAQEFVYEFDHRRLPQFKK